MDYEQQAVELLTKYDVGFSAELIGADCPLFCKHAEKGVDMDKVNTFPRRTHIHGKHYRITLTRRSGAAIPPLVIDFWNSYADEEFNAWRFKSGKLANSPTSLYWDKFKGHRADPLKTPTPYDVLACLTKSDPGTFEDFCGDFGYDTDSRKAEATWRLVVEEWHKAEAFFTADELVELQEVS